QRLAWLDMPAHPVVGFDGADGRVEVHPKVAHFQQRGTHPSPRNLGSSESRSPSATSANPSVVRQIASAGYSHKWVLPGTRRNGADWDINRPHSGTFGGTPMPS